MIWSLDKGQLPFGQAVHKNRIPTEGTRKRAAFLWDNFGSAFTDKIIHILVHSDAGRTIGINNIFSSRANGKADMNELSNATAAS